MNKKYFSPELEIQLIFEDILSNSGAEAEADAAIEAIGEWMHEKGRNIK